MIVPRLDPPSGPASAGLAEMIAHTAATADNAFFIFNSIRSAGNHRFCTLGKDIFLDEREIHLWNSSLSNNLISNINHHSKPTRSESKKQKRFIWSE